MSAKICTVPNCKKHRWHNSTRCVKHQTVHQFGVCDVCSNKFPREQIAIIIAYGIETAACTNCRGTAE